MVNFREIYSDSILGNLFPFPGITRIIQKVENHYKQVALIIRFLFTISTKQYKTAIVCRVILLTVVLDLITYHQQFSMFFHPKNTVFLEKKLPKTTIVCPKCAPWRSNQEWRSIGANTVCRTS